MIFFFHLQKYHLDETHINALKDMFNNPSAPTTTTTATPVDEQLSGDQFRTVEQKLNDIYSKLNVVSGAVFAFIVLAVVILAGFSLIQYYHNKKMLRRDNELPKYVEHPYGSKP